MAAKQTNQEQNTRNQQNWLKIITYLLKFTDITFNPSKINAINDKFISLFKSTIKNKYENW